METSELTRKVREIRIKKGLSQEDLANETGLSLRTIQRIENGETVPRGDTLKRLAATLKVSPDEIIDWKALPDKNVLTMLNLSQLCFIPFPLLGIIVPLIIWIIKKDKIEKVDSVGKSILNFQISWTLVLCSYYLFFMILLMFHIRIFPINMKVNLFIIGGLYAYNVVLIFVNTIRYLMIEKVSYIPAIRLLK